MNLTCSGSSRRRARSPCTNALDRQLVAAQLPYGSRFRLIKARGGRAALPRRLLQLPPLSLLLFSAKGPPAFPTAFSACADSLCTSFTEVALLYMPHCTIALLDLLHHHRTANKVRQNGEHHENASHCYLTVTRRLTRQPLMRILIQPGNPCPHHITLSIAHITCNAQ
jgi:hypothetical protein